jgi:hypothetical protein
LNEIINVKAYKEKYTDNGIIYYFKDGCCYFYGDSGFLAIREVVVNNIQSLSGVDTSGSSKIAMEIISEKINKKYYSSHQIPDRMVSKYIDSKYENNELVMIRL